MSTLIPLYEDYAFEEIVQAQGQIKYGHEQQTLTTLIKDILRKDKLPSCSECKAFLFDTVCIYLEGQIYCQKCSKKQIEALLSNGQCIQCYEHLTLDLGKRISKLQHWSIGDQMQYQVLAQQRQSAPNYEGLGSHILLGNNMLNKKTSAQILQYISQVNQDKSTSTKEIEYHNDPRHKTIEISSEMLSIESNKKEFIFIHQSFKNQQQNLVKCINSQQKTKNKKFSQFLYYLKVQQTKTMIDIYQDLMEQYRDIQDSHRPKKIKSVKQFDIQEELSNTNYQEDPKSLEIEPLQQVAKMNSIENEINREFREFMISINSKESEKKQFRTKGIKKQNKRSKKKSI